MVYTKATDDSRNYLYIEGIEVGGPITGVTMKYALADGTTGTAKNRLRGCEQVYCHHHRHRAITYKGSEDVSTTQKALLGKGRMA